MNAASLANSNGRGVAKRKGTRSRVFTRNRSKVEKIRESLKHLKLEEKQISPTRNKASRGNPGWRGRFHDLDAGISDQEISVQINKLTLPLGASKHCWPKNKAEKSQAASDTDRLCLTRSEWSKSSCSSSGSCSGMLNYCSDTKEQYLLKEREALQKCDSDWSKEYQTPKNFSSKLENAGLVDKNIKRKGVNDLKETISKNFKGEKVCWEKLDFTAGQREKAQATATEESNIAIDKEQCSPSPPNSPLYDMPPPSTPAQKQARRAKRHLQLERWKKFEASRSRQERYHKRSQEASKTMQKTISMDSRRVQWSDDLVQTVYIDDNSDEPNLAGLME